MFSLNFTARALKFELVVLIVIQNQCGGRGSVAKMADVFSQTFCGVLFTQG